MKNLFLTILLFVVGEVSFLVNAQETYTFRCDNYYSAETWYWAR